MRRVGMGQAGLIVGLVSLVAACGGAGSGGGAPAGDDPASLPPIEGGSGQADGGPDGQAACDPAALPTDNPCVIHEGAAVFASASRGTTGAEGTRARPFKSLRDAIASAAAQGKRVYACAESYPESITLANGVSVFGNFDCGGEWLPGTGRAVIASPDPVAVRAKAITAPTRLMGLRVQAADAKLPSESSIGILAQGAPGLVLTQVSVRAGSGASGANGVEAVPVRVSGAIDGTASSPAVRCDDVACPLGSNGPRAGGQATCTMPDGSLLFSRGGTGGAGGKFRKKVMIAMPPLPPTTPYSEIVEAAGEGNSGDTPSPALALAAQGGQAGAPGKDGAPGSSSGVFSEAGYAPSHGLAGAVGAVGQAGGGGRGAALPADHAVLTSMSEGTIYLGHPGGGGGAGGCPGAPGTPGMGGGASVGILLIGSPVRIESSSVESGQGGAGGQGVFGSVPTAGGKGGPPNGYLTAAQAGGAGGSGGRAGVSGSGGGGPSFALVHKGGAPTVLATSLTPGSPGAGVPSLDRAGLGTIAASPAGLRADSYAAP